MITYRSDAFKKRMAVQQKEKDKHRAKLEKKHGLKGHPKAEKLYDLAWEHGHSSGYDEVGFYYDDFATLLKEE